MTYTKPQASRRALRAIMELQKSSCPPVEDGTATHE
jgi:hypothetical protein